MGTARLQKRYEGEIRQAVMAELGITNVMRAPRLSKIVVNTGLGQAIQNQKLIEAGVEQIGLITGQQPVVTRARRSIATFKLREGMRIGVMVTLRRDRMYEFFDRLISVALPRVRDFKGISPKSFDGRGNYSLGIKEQLIFPEIPYDKVEVVKGLNITICTTAQTDDEGRALLRAFGMPFRAN